MAIARSTRAIAIVTPKVSSSPSNENEYELSTCTAWSPRSSSCSSNDTSGIGTSLEVGTELIAAITQSKSSPEPNASMICVMPSGSSTNATVAEISSYWEIAKGSVDSGSSGERANESDVARAVSPTNVPSSAMNWARSATHALVAAAAGSSSSSLGRRSRRSDSSPGPVDSKPAPVT